MADKLSSLLQDKSVRRALSQAVKASGSTPSGKVVGALVVLVLVAAVWVGSQVPTLVDAPGDGAPPAASDGGSARSAGTAVSDAASQAAVRDVQRASAAQKANLDPSTFDQVTVRHVVDGDTIAVATESGEHVSVRLIGIDTPESVAPQEERNCPEGVIASDRMKQLVQSGDTLWLQCDTSVTDQYDRPLAYVWRELPADADQANDPAVMAAHMLNALQVIDGYGQAKTYRPDTLHDGLFAQWGREAIDAGLGVTAKWA